MPADLITTQPSPWGRRARTFGRLVLAVAVTVLHLAVAVVVLGVRIAHVITTVAATHAAYAELYLSRHTGRPPLGQATGAALAHAFATEFRTAYHATTTR